MKKLTFYCVIAFFIGIVWVSFYRHNVDVEEFRWSKHWDEIDLDVVKKQYQPYTVREMHDMWHDKLTIKYGGKYGGAEGLRKSIGKAADVYPQHTFLARMLEFGRPFVDFSDYEHALTNQRTTLYSIRIYWESMTAAERAIYLEQRGLPTDATWEQYEEVLFKNEVVNSINVRRSKEQDPYMNGTISSCFDYIAR